MNSENNITLLPIFENDHFYLVSINKKEGVVYLIDSLNLKHPEIESAIKAKLIFF